MRDLAHFLSYMNNTAYRYVVLRNWENLPHNVETGIHSDLDLLLYDLDHFLELFPHLEREYKAPRVRFKLTFDDGQFIFLDARHIGDSYYPLEFEENILKTREWNKAGFWTPNPIHHRIGLVYHAVHHKGANTYPNFLGKESVPSMLDALKQNRELAWVEPDDYSVGKFNPYQLGGTSVVTSNGTWVEKQQTCYKEYSLIENEERMLNLVNNAHFPKVISRDGDSIRIEHCGEPLTATNLPTDWKEQLAEILEALTLFGVVHRDIRLDNLMVRDNIIKLLDFGWARLKDEVDGKHPDLLGYPNKCPLGFNDGYSMNMVIRSLEMEREELCQIS